MLSINLGRDKLKEFLNGPLEAILLFTEKLISRSRKMTTNKKNYRLFFLYVLDKYIYFIAPLIFILLSIRYTAKFLLKNKLILEDNKIEITINDASYTFLDINYCDLTIYLDNILYCLFSLFWIIVLLNFFYQVLTLLHTILRLFTKTFSKNTLSSLSRDHIDTTNAT